MKCLSNCMSKTKKDEKSLFIVNIVAFNVLTDNMKYIQQSIWRWVKTIQFRSEAMITFDYVLKLFLSEERASFRHLYTYKNMNSTSMGTQKEGP